jgi:hypothetical protein
VSPVNLVAVMFSTLAAEMADPERFRRGRTYVRQHAVASIDVQPAVVHGEVQGSRPEPYEVTIRTRPVRRATALAAVGPDGTTARPSMLVPRPDDLRVSCTCPDWGDPCKHAVAVLLALGEELAADPELLATWRQMDAPAPDDATSLAAAASRGGPRHEPDPLDGFFARGYDPDPVPPLPPLVAKRRSFDGGDAVAELVLPCVDSARAELAALFGQR